MERLFKMPVRLCSSCLENIPLHLSCMNCAAKRLFSSVIIKPGTGKRVPSQPLSFPMSSTLKLSPLMRPLHNGGFRHNLLLSTAACQQFYGILSSRIASSKKISSYEIQNVSIPALLPLRLYSTGPTGPKLPPKKSKLDSEKSPISWRNLLIVAGIAGVLLYGMKHVKEEKELERQKARNRLIGKARLGGDWTLTDHHGNKRSSTDFRGQWILIYFGFTHCPDICPEEIEKIVKVINKTDADPDLPKIQPIIITVDPERDTPEALKEYCAEFSPRLLGFTGTVDEIQQATRAFRVYFSAGPKDEDNDYIVDHSIISYLINPRGEFVEYFGQNKTADQIVPSVRFHILKYMKDNPA